MPEKSYAHRDVLDKLGIVSGTRVLFEGPVPSDLERRVEERGALRASLARRGTTDEPVDIVLYRLTDPDRAPAALVRLRARIAPAGAIWVLTAKRGQPDYVMQEVLIPVGKRAGLVDNKSCSVDDAISGLRFVIPRDRR